MQRVFFRNLAYILLILKLYPLGLGCVVSSLCLGFSVGVFLFSYPSLLATLFRLCNIHFYQSVEVMNAPY